MGEAVPQVGPRWRIEDTHQLDPWRWVSVEEPIAVAEQDRCGVDLDLVEVPRREKLPDDVPAARNGDVPVAGRSPSLFQGGLDAFRDEGERGLAPQHERLGRVMAQREDLHAEPWRVGPPSGRHPVALPTAA